MFEGRLLAIGICKNDGVDVVSVSDIEAVANVGLSGDRYAEKSKPKSAITLIEIEALRAAKRDHDFEISHLASRRNLLTESVPLNHLVDREFTVGEVRLRGVELCEPCGYLEKMTSKGAIKALLHRGGLRAEIVESGKISVGDKVCPV